MKAIPVNNAKKEYVELELDGRTYKIALTLNAIIELQTVYGDLTSVMEKSRDLKQLLVILKILINEAVDNHNDTATKTDIWDHVDEKYIGRKLNITKIKSLKGFLPVVFGVSLPVNNKDDDDETVVSEEMQALLDEIPENEDEKNSDTE